MDDRFRTLIESLAPKVDGLVAMSPVTVATLPRSMPERGIYLFSESRHHLYVGRTNRLRQRIREHGSPSGTRDSAPFAFRLAREATGRTRATYRAGDGSRAALAADPLFASAFETAKGRIAAMLVRYVEEPDPTRQALLEIYAATVLETPYNDFDTH